MWDYELSPYDTLQRHKVDYIRFDLINSYKGTNTIKIK